MTATHARPIAAIPATGVQHEVIPGCDSSLTVAGGRFETRSVLGRVLTRSGAAVPNFDVEVYDAPIDGDARADVELSAGNDGSFRARLSEFPELFDETTPSHHLVVRVITADVIPALRDVYVRPGDATDSVASTCWAAIRKARRGPCGPVAGLRARPHGKARPWPNSC